MFIFSSNTQSDLLSPTKNENQFSQFEAGTGCYMAQLSKSKRWNLIDIKWRLGPRTSLKIYLTSLSITVPPLKKATLVHV
jgi:hypothetical protein